MLNLSAIGARKVYQIILHAGLIILLIEVVVLARQNRELKLGKEIAGLRIGDTLVLNQLEPMRTGDRIDTTDLSLFFLFSTNCQFCQKNLEPWALLAELAGSSELTVNGISLDSREKTAAFAQNNPLPYPIFLSLSSQQFRKVNHINGVPQTILRSGTGEVVGVWTGVLSDSIVAERVMTISATKQ